MPSILDSITSQARTQAQNLASSSAKTALSAAGLTLTSTPAPANTVMSQAAVGRVSAWSGDSVDSNWVGRRSSGVQAIPNEFTSKAAELRSKGFSSNQAGSIISTAKVNARNLGTNVYSEIDLILNSIRAKGWWPGQSTSTPSPSSLLPNYDPLPSAPQVEEKGLVTPVTIGIAALAAILLLRK